MRLLPLDGDLVIDSFAGGGGASAGIEAALSRPVNIAINHNAVALGLHAVNHPNTHHVTENVWDITPKKIRALTNGAPVGLLWASPDCRHFSRAKGGKPVKKEIRGLAWTVLRFAWAARPRVVILENVQEFETWGPLTRTGRPCKRRKGQTFDRWVSQLRGMGYAVEWRRLRACDYGAPTIRERLFLIARRDGQPIVWPAPTHGPGLEPYRTAASIIDWSQPCPSIFDRKRPLAEATMRRIAKGIQRYVLEADRPFIINLTHGVRLESVDEPMRTVTAAHRGEKALCVPTLIQTGYGEREGQDPRVPGLDKPLGTAVSGCKHALVSAFITKHFGGMVGVDAREPYPTITAKGCQNVVTTCSLSPEAETRAEQVAAFLIRYNGLNIGQSLREPLGAGTSKPRFAMVHVHGVPYTITDIGMRMLTPREMFRAQGFPDTYIIDRTIDGQVITKTQQYALAGNSVCPPVARALVEANVVPAVMPREVAA